MLLLVDAAMSSFVLNRICNEVLHIDADEQSDI